MTAMLKWALLAASESGSTWVNHVLSSHPCIVSQNEYLVLEEERRIFRSSEAGALQVLQHITTQNELALHRRNASSICPHTAGGVKLKTLDRDVTASNARMVSEALAKAGYVVILLERGNSFEHTLGGLSRKEAGFTHCDVDTCDPTSLNITRKIDCGDLLHQMRAYENGLDTISQNVAMYGPERQRRLVYELLLRTAVPWLDVMELLGFPRAAACALKSDLQKRVQQTQSEMVHNYEDVAKCLSDSGRSHLLRPTFRPSSGSLPRDQMASPLFRCPTQRGPPRAPAPDGTAQRPPPPPSPIDPTTTAPPAMAH